MLTPDDVTPEDVSSFEDTLLPLLAAFPSRNSITVKFGFLRSSFCKENQGSHAAALATGSDRPVRAALLATCAEYDVGGDNLMNVPTSFGQHFTFCKNYLGLPKDPEGRRYDVYRPALVCAPPPAPGIRDRLHGLVRTTSRGRCMNTCQKATPSPCPQFSLVNASPCPWRRCGLTLKRR